MGNKVWTDFWQHLITSQGYGCYGQRLSFRLVGIDWPRHLLTYIQEQLQCSILRATGVNGDFGTGTLVLLVLTL